MELPTSSSSWFKDFMGAAGLDISAGKPPHKAPIGPPMTLDNMRMNGVRDLLVICLTHRCEHNATFNVDAYPGELPVKWFEPRMRCTKCSGKCVHVRPAWDHGDDKPSEMHALRRHRLGVREP